MIFEILPDGKKAHTCHQFLRCHMVFDIKVEDFRHKARLVAGNHMTAQSTIMFAIILSSIKVRIPLMIAILNDLEFKLGNI